jgi:hypothetical protein
MSIFTGHTSAQAPHSEEAHGREVCDLRPWSWGVRIAPIGPGYVEA